ncbi:hypothetical protein [Jeotgalibacillus haloalkalitolerans]|uniref:Uncharacterized protein n=1 Tax=Jeotgalibacillus haloalkalitolerans TaxID=3104292 RepID=A0ABU5KNU6_9BACL|nr:hypothetical protein [Jeotgalibacillus sp. HH7-29]MDZ5712753.1 hypothetical protein [Jeotgalibacillus sp. HH7-29]
MKFLKILYIFITGTIISYYYGLYMPKDGVVQGILYWIAAALVGIIYYLIYRWIFSRFEGENDI